MSAFDQNPVLNLESYAPSLVRYQRRLTEVVTIGDVPMGGHFPIRVQSMTTTDTMDTKGTVEQSIRMAEAGCEYIRITAPSVKEAENLAEIRKELHRQGVKIPLVADIHFTPNAAEVAARLVEKVRINPGNYADKKRFETINYTDESYAKELERIREKFVPLVKICKEYGTAMRIGTNHGSLSDRILSRYGDTPLGMVESALEFLRICEDLNYYNIVLSMKASNTQVMVQAYRMLVRKLAEEGLKAYPLHLGVTEAGEAEDGRIKSAVGIGALLEDGLGDTIRVSLTEAPEMEIPVARLLADRYTQRVPHEPIKEYGGSYSLNPFHYERRGSQTVANFGGVQVPRVIADFSSLDTAHLEYKDLKSIGHFYLPEPDKWTMNDLGADYVYVGANPIAFMLPMGLRQIVDGASWLSMPERHLAYPLWKGQELATATWHSELSFVSAKDTEVLIWTSEDVRQLPQQAVLVIESDNLHQMAALRRAALHLISLQCKLPVVWKRSCTESDSESLHLYASTDIGGLLIDGLGDGIWLTPNTSSVSSQERLKVLNALAFGILQAARTRMSKTEYISCPSCGRTLFDLQETTAMIRQRTDHLKGIKIGIMGCIVNGPGEMADADYGYVGVGKDKIALYRGQDVVKKAVPAEQALDQLIDLIREDGRWLEPQIDLIHTL
jgi:(E)-4-hydroxy-3-methylbut-2-enyl-diphosphate synthase